MSDDWPKPWGEITGSSLSLPTVDFGPLRIYEETVYINADGGHEGENGDKWLPLAVYLRRDD